MAKGSNSTTQTPSAPAVVAAHLPFEAQKSFAITSALYVRLTISGADAFDLLERLSSTNLADLDGVGRTALFTSDKGRCVALFAAWRIGNQVGAICFSPSGDEFCKHLERYTVIEDVEVADLSATTAQITVVGGLVGDLPPAVKSLKGPYEWGVERYELVMPNDMLSDTCERLQNAGFSLLNHAAFETLRIGQGWPATGTELNLDHNPLEAGLQRLVDLDRCYTGQEVLARLDTYDKLQRRLFKLRLTDVLPSEDELFASATKAGWITSRADEWGLGYIRRKFACPGETLTTVSGGKVQLEAIPAWTRL